jgi:recombination protein RecT
MSNENNGRTVVTSKIQSLKTALEAESVQQQFRNALQDNSGPFTASIIDLYNTDTYLQNCEPKLVIMECLKAAILKLPIIKSLGFAYIVPFKKNNVQLPQFIIGYKGLIQLAMRTGQYRIINADVVYEGEFRSANKLTGEYDLSGKQTSDKIVGYFAHIEMLNGYTKTLYSTVEKINAHASKYSKSYNTQYSPWKTEFDSMAQKTVLRGLLGKWGYLSIEMLSSLTDDDVDVAETVGKEIKVSANKKEMSFDEAHMVNENAEVFEQNDSPGF